MDSEHIAISLFKVKPSDKRAFDKERNQWKNTVAQFGLMLHKENPKFDLKKFYFTCHGVKEI